MPPQARISVVIPARDAADTLGAALDSLLLQTRHDWEALVVDDGSADGTRRIALDYARRDPRIRLMDGGDTTGPEGVSAARNRGLAAATGCYVLFLDADDWIAPDALKTLSAALQAHPDAAAAYCAHRRVTTGGRIGPPAWDARIAAAPFDALARSFDTAMHAVMMVRPTIDRLGGFDASLRTCEDWDLLQRLARTGLPFVAVPDALVYYRMSPGSLSKDARALLPDARMVIERAFVPDARVPAPAPDHAQGTRQARGMSRHMAFGLFSVWCAAVEAAQDRDGCDLLQPLPDNRDWVVEACRGIILDGLSLGGGCLVSELASQAPRLGGRVRRLCAAVAEVSGRPSLAAELDYALGPEVLGAAPDESRVIGRTLHVRQDLAQLAAVAPSDDADRINIEVRDGGRVVTHIVLPAEAAAKRSAVARAAVDAVGTRAFTTANGLYHQPGFWLDAARDSLSFAVAAHGNAAVRAILREGLHSAAARRLR